MNTKEKIEHTLNGSRVGRHDNLSAFVAELAPLIEKLQGFRDPTLLPARDQEVRAAVIKLAHLLKERDPVLWAPQPEDYSQDVPDEARQAHNEQVAAYMFSLRKWVAGTILLGDMLEAEPVRAEADRIEIPILLIAELWQFHFGACPGAGANSSFAALFTPQSAVLPRELWADGKTVRTALQKLKKEGCLG